MWLFTKIGFFSATLTNASYTELPFKQQKGHVMVRARVKRDLERMLEIYKELGFTEKYGPSDVPPILELPGHDYPYRVVMSKAHWAGVVAQLIQQLDYSNFKNAIIAEDPSQLQARHDLYVKVWQVMYHAERDILNPPRRSSCLSAPDWFRDFKEKK